MLIVSEAKSKPLPIRLLKGCFQQPDSSVQGCTAHLSNTQTFDNWSKAKPAVFALRAEKDHGRTFLASF
jgi:hypothetical protein